jgi:hypothetical protein
LPGAAETSIRNPARIRTSQAVNLLRAETAHLANDCFRDLDGLGADDSYGDDPVVVVARAACCRRDLGLAICGTQPVREARPAFVLAEVRARRVQLHNRCAPGRRWLAQRGCAALKAGAGRR